MKLTNRVVVLGFIYVMFLGIYLEVLVRLMSAADTLANLLGLTSILLAYLLSVKYFKKITHKN